MNISAKYSHADIEDKWYSYWIENNFFRSEPDGREPYTIVIPPPNVTGVLHMGHMLNNTIQDVLVRRARMLGKNACWVPGTDHASIATEAKVVDRLAKKGIKKDDLSREEFIEHAWEWTREHGGIILEQLKKLGASCDWERTCFTMDKARSESVIKAFIALYKKGKVYRRARMINWDPSAKTAVSDEEVVYKEEKNSLYYIRYGVEGSDNDWVTVATTRPETILGDTAVCVNPGDKRFAHLIGKRVLVPLINRSVPVIKDEYVDMEFGTGCLKITPAHDINDYEIGLRHNLEIIDTFNDDGTLSEEARILVGEDRFDARKKIVPMLKEAGNMVKVEDYINKVGYSERTDVVIEPRLSTQWFLKMSELAKPALNSVVREDINFYPGKFKNIYRYWMDNIRDWCISRQLWWGHRIPVYYLEDGSYVVAESKEEAVNIARESRGDATITVDSLRQDEDVLDTWASSWLWPISVFDGISNPDNKDIKYYYPTNDLVTGHDIIFFWVARMIMAGYEYREAPPFKNVYFTGMVRDKERRKMSKQLGNSPEPLTLISKYGADGVRVGMLLCAPAGGDLLFEESLTEQGRNFSSKVWNSFRLVSGWKVDSSIEQPEYARQGLDWFCARLNEIIELMNAHFSKFRISDALMVIYTAIRDDFSGWLLEVVKPEYQKPIDIKTHSEVIALFDKILRLLHPFMPFISEEIWQLLLERGRGESIMVAAWPKVILADSALPERFESVKEAVSGFRTIRKEKNIAGKEKLHVSVIPGEKGYEPLFSPVLCKMANIAELNVVDGGVEGAVSFRVKSTEFCVSLNSSVSLTDEIVKVEEELKYATGFLNSVMKKLGNKRFVANAPENVVETEQKKQADAEEKISLLKDKLHKLNDRKDSA